MDWWQRRTGVAEAATALGPAIVTATVAIYNAIRAELLPTPAKSHYTYNMRDLSKVFQGISMIGTPVADAPSMARLWAHETLRVFHDRLVSDEDRAWFCGYLKSMVEEHLKIDFGVTFNVPEAVPGQADPEVQALRKLLYADFFTSAVRTDLDLVLPDVNDLQILLVFH